MLVMYTNPKMKYRGNLNKDRQRWTKTCRSIRLLMEGCNKFWNRPRASNLSIMTMFLEKTMNQEVAWFASSKIHGIDYVREGCRSLVGCDARYSPK